jgi:hypothetical protein
MKNLNKCEFGLHLLVYLGYVIGGGELKIDPANMEVILKWPTPTNVTKVRRFFGVLQYLWTFIAFFLVVATPFHAITTRDKNFQWRKNQ